MSLAATHSVPSPRQVTESIPDDPPLVRSGVEEAYQRWWASVEAVHAILLLGDAETEAVTETLDAERQLRREYATSLRGSNRQVPDYLDDSQAFPPLWPTPEPPYPA